MANIHPSSLVDAAVELAPDVVIGPFCVVRGRVRLGPGCVLESHVSLGSEHGIVEVGKDNRFSAGSVIGGPPQDISYRGEPTKLVIGDGNAFREMVTVNIGTQKGGGVTRIGNGCLIMAYVHVAHDCQIGNQVIIANSVQFAGHVVIEDSVRISGICAFNQFVRVGRYAYIAGDSAVHKDVLPFSMAQGRYAEMRACNRVGMERAGFPKEVIDQVNRSIRIITKGDGTIEERLARIDQECDQSAEVLELVQFIRSSTRGLAL